MLIRHSTEFCRKTLDLLPFFQALVDRNSLLEHIEGAFSKCCVLSILLSPCVVRLHVSMSSDRPQVPQALFLQGRDLGVCLRHDHQHLSSFTICCVNSRKHSMIGMTCVRISLGIQCSSCISISSTFPVDKMHIGVLAGLILVWHLA